MEKGLKNSSFPFRIKILLLNEVVEKGGKVRC